MPASTVTIIVGYDTLGIGNVIPDHLRGEHDRARRSPTSRTAATAICCCRIRSSRPRRLSGDKNFGGFFSTNTVHGIGNSDVLSGNNKQSTRLGGVAPGIAGTVQDGSLTSDACISNLTPGVDCSLIDGETSVVTVGDGGDDPGWLLHHHPLQERHHADRLRPHVRLGQQEKISACADPTILSAPCFTWDRRNDDGDDLHDLTTARTPSCTSRQRRPQASGGRERPPRSHPFARTEAGPPGRGALLLRPGPASP